MSTGINIASSSGLTVGTTTVTSGTDGRVFFQAGGVLQQSASLFWDNVNERLGVGGTPGAFRLDVNGTARVQGDFLATTLYLGTSTTINTVGFYTATTNVLGIFTNGSERIRVGNTGNVLIGTITDSGFKFDVNGTTRLNGNTSIGGSTAGARLDVRAADGLSNPAFRVRNSVDTANLMQVAGDNTMTFLSSTGKIIFSQDTVGQGSVISLRRDFSNQEIIRLDGTNGGGITINPLNDGSVKSVAIGSIANGISMWSTGLTSHNFQIKNSFHNLFHVVGDPNSATATFRVGTTASNTNFFNVHGRNAGGTGLTTDPIFTINSNGNFANGATTFGANAQFVFAHGNGTAPTTSPADAYQQYSADITAGNAAPHFRTENGNIIKLYRETTAVAAATFVSNTSLIANDTATFDGYTIGQVVKALRNLGILA